MTSSIAASLLSVAAIGAIILPKTSFSCVPRAPISLSAQFRRIQRRIPLRLQTMTGSTHRIERLACGSIAGDLSRGLRERRIAAQPRLKSALFLHHDAATHDKMPGATQFVAEEVEFSGPGGREPDIGDQR